MKIVIRTLVWLVAVAIVSVGSAATQQPPVSAPPATVAPKIPQGITVGDDYVIGPDDVLVVVFWREKDMSTEVVVRPDGKITVPLLNDIPAAGLTPEQLREKLTTAAARYIEDPQATVVVKQINSRNVFIVGQVGKPGSYKLSGPMTVLQLIAMAGGLGEFARRKEIVIIRMDAGRQQSLPFDYDAVSKRSKLQQNILLKPGDQIIVP